MKQITTVRELAKLYPELHDFNYKWRDCENPESERDIENELHEKGYKFKDENSSDCAGQYNDLKGYFECEIVPLATPVKETEPAPTPTSKEGWEDGGLPEKLDVHSTGLFPMKAELHPINDPDGLIVLADVQTMVLANEIATRYNNFPTMLEALKKASKLIYDMKDRYCMKDGFLKDNALFDAETELEIEAILTRINKD